MFIVGIWIKWNILSMDLLGQVVREGRSYDYATEAFLFLQDRHKKAQDFNCTVPAAILIFLNYYFLFSPDPPSIDKVDRLIQFWFYLKMDAFGGFYIYKYTNKNAQSAVCFMGEISSIIPCFFWGEKKSQLIWNDIILFSWLLHIIPQVLHKKGRAYNRNLYY